MFSPRFILFIWKVSLTTPDSRPLRRGETRPFLCRIAVSCYRGCVWIVGTQWTSRFAYWHYICRLIDVVCVCMYVPVIGCIAPAIYRSRMGLLLACWNMLGDRVRAYDGLLRARGASSLCCNSGFKATAPGRDPTFPV